MRHKLHIFLSLPSDLIEFEPLILAIEHIIVKFITGLLTAI